MSELLSYVPFRDPLWGAWNYWYLFLVPLSVLLAVAYKGIRIERIEELPRVAGAWTLKLLVSLLALAAVLWVIAWAAARWA
jgi:hypothetical protein